MSSTFDEFWSLAVEEPSLVSAVAIKDAMRLIYNAQSSSTKAQEIISAIELAATVGINGQLPRKLNFIGSFKYSAIPATMTINVAEGPVGSLLPVKIFNTSGLWVEEALYKTLAHELAHLVFPNEAVDPGSGMSTSDIIQMANTTANMDLLGGAERAANDGGSG